MKISSLRYLPISAVKKLPNFILIALASLVALFIVLVTLFFIWTRNPYGLEEERLGPKGNEKLPPISSVENAVNFLLFPQHEGNNFIIHFPVPNEYINPSNTSTRFKKTYAVGIKMYYPEMHGGFHPKNTHLLNCNGHCEGYVFAYVGVNVSGAKAQNARRLESIYMDRAQNSPLRRFEDLDSEFGLNDHIQIRYPAIEEKSKGDKYSTKEYFLKRDQNGEVQYLFECHPFVTSPGCSVKFNLSSRPEVLVDINFGRHLMGNWSDIIKEVDMKIASWKPLRLDAVLQQ